MFQNRLWLFFWIALFLSTVEVGLEYRAHLRGWDSPVFGRAGLSDGDESGSAAQAARIYGPAPGFPFRSRIVGAEKDRETTRIWIASASYAQDEYQPPTKIFPVRLEEQLTDSGHSVQVLNASQAGWGVQANIDMLQDLAPIWSPDVAILYQGSADIGQLISAYLAAEEIQTVEDDERDLNDDATPARPNWTVRFVESTTVYSILKGYVSARIAKTRVLSDELPPEAFETLEKRVVAFIAAARAVGAVPVLSTFATSHHRKDLGNFPSSVTTMLFKYNLHLSLLGWVDTVEKFNRLMAEVAQEYDVLLIDVDAAFADAPQLFRDYIHFAPEGHDRVAVTLANGLQKAALVPLPRTGDWAE
ncbi:MAG: GDSL-type esterase/lipase family protein [Myxococcota bacterium]|nr:GDSL-type esterase/lipase family protein [Myxococcota bacterium]